MYAGRVLVETFIAVKIMSNEYFHLIEGQHKHPHATNDYTPRKHILFNFKPSWYLACWDLLILPNLDWVVDTNTSKPLRIFGTLEALLE